MAKPPYPWISRELRAGRVIPFLGAGASFGNRNPRKKKWRHRVKGAWKMSFLPTASELSEDLASLSNYPEKAGELTKVAQYFSTFVSAKSLRERLFEIFAFEHGHWPIHTYLAEVAKRKPLLIVTTNYDDLMERALEKAGALFETVIHQTDKALVQWRHSDGTVETINPSKLAFDFKQHTAVYKIHGAIDRTCNAGQFVITEDDYIDFITRMTRKTVIPRGFAIPFQTYPFLFLGYGLYDWNLRVVFNQIDNARGPAKIASWAIETLAKPLEKEFWTHRNVRVFDELTLDEFVADLRKAGKK